MEILDIISYNIFLSTDFFNTYYLDLFVFSRYYYELVYAFRDWPMFFVNNSLTKQ